MNKPQSGHRADANPAYLAYLDERVRGICRDSGLHIPHHKMLEALVDLVVDELTVLRERGAYIIDTSGAFCGGTLEKDQIERLAYIMLTHYLADDGSVQLPDEAE